MNQEGKRLRDCLRRSNADSPLESRAIGKRLPVICTAPNTAQSSVPVNRLFPDPRVGLGELKGKARLSTYHVQSTRRQGCTGHRWLGSIGAEICRQLANSGAVVAVHCHRSLAAAEDLIEEIEAEGGEAFVVRGDLSEEDDQDAIIESVIEHGGRLDSCEQRLYI